MSYKHLFSHVLNNQTAKLHLAAHSHHAWPDCTFEAQKQCWKDAAEKLDDKWSHIFGTILPDVQKGIAEVLNLSSANGISFAPNTHDFLVRLFSCFDHKKPVQILSTDSEFHSFSRQAKRWVEAGQAKVHTVPAEPLETFNERFIDAAHKTNPDFIYLSHVFFNSGMVVPNITGLVQALPPEAVVAVDGYHGFMAIPTDFSKIENRAFYLSGGYKYAMSGEGLCFMHCPKGWLPRPVDTGWYAGFGALEKPQDGRVPFGEDGSRFMGATFDPSGLYRMRAVFEMLRTEGLTVEKIHAHVQELQHYFIETLAAAKALPIATKQLIPGRHAQSRGHFLTFQTEKAGEIYQSLHDNGIVTDYRANRLRFGLGIYHEKTDIDALFKVLDELTYPA